MAIKESVLAAMLAAGTLASVAPTEAEACDHDGRPRIDLSLFLNASPAVICPQPALIIQPQPQVLIVPQAQIMPQPIFLQQPSVLVIPQYSQPIIQQPSLVVVPQAQIMPQPIFLQQPSVLVIPQYSQAYRYGHNQRTVEQQGSMTFTPRYQQRDFQRPQVPRLNPRPNADPRQYRYR